MRQKERKIVIEIMETIKEVFNYIQNEYKNNLEEIKLKKGLQRRLKDETIEQKLDETLNRFIKIEGINVKVKLGPVYNRRSYTLDTIIY